MSKSKIYNKQFYENNQCGSVRSAQACLPTILKYIKPKSVVDLGCGTGTWLSVFKKLGVKDIYGLDGDYVNREMLLIPKENFHPANLANDILLNRKFDLAISLEVAEHIPAKLASTFIKNITRLAPVVIFSAAIPGQGGDDHINEQWPSYWVNLFKQEGFVLIDCLREKFWSDDRIEMWYAQNMLMFVSKKILQNNNFLNKEYQRSLEKIGQLDLVHPKMFFIEQQRARTAYQRENLFYKMLALPKRIIRKIFKIINRQK